MGSIHSPGSGGPKDPFEKYRIAEIQKDRESGDMPEGKQAALPRTPAFIAYIILLFKKFLDLFGTSTERGLSSSAEEDVRSHLLALKKALQVLMMEDKSQDVPFLNHLSTIWHQILENMLRFKRTTPFSQQMRSFVKMLQQYPEGQEHSLGYYLSEYAGYRWLPFPFMEMIHKLYWQHKTSKNSLLVEWSRSLEAMIAILRR